MNGPHMPDAAARSAQRAAALRLVSLLLLAFCALLTLQPTAAPSLPRVEAPAHEWPAHWEGRPLRPLAFSAVEQRFAQHFPGRMARFSDGTQIILLREVQAPTRMLHPAADCYRASGFQIADTRLARDAAGALWRCFVARGGAAPLQVCERIVDADGQAFTDTSSWYWSALTGRSRGPWQAVTRAQAFATEHALF
jgi:hypothetical protein